MMTQTYDDESPMEIDASNNAFAQDEETTTSIDTVFPAILFSPNKQLELPVNLSERDLLGEFITDQSINEDDVDNNDNSSASESNEYAPHACYSPDDAKKRFPTFRSEFKEDHWSHICEKTMRFFVRKQSRNDRQRRNVHENDIELQYLTRELGNVSTVESFWFHATSWESAIEKVEKGPKISEGPLDMAYYGAFYLNPDYHDCHDWFYTRDSKFQGKHAMLIYKFHSETLSKKGKSILEKQKWKTVAGERSQSSGKFEDDWTYTYQNSDPDHIHKSGDNARIRHRWDELPAMQLIIYTEKMCRKIHRCLVGCVYYENCDALADELNNSNQIINDNQLDSSANSSTFRNQSQFKVHKTKRPK
ncbi:unnamed protein product [Rotaria magnacalcarata]|uniref:Uncharacterized protein n=1 Tax=Rotaria magnacalcarata TaxID=392030 RepID=A0A815RRK2_9BILA|nr:unnamed protein product [Rotaria magnacalcarata]CAF1480348.1 unnamed protein product [Rotaria magnacalcarata]